MKRLFALRGASQALNTPRDIREQTALMYDELLDKNNLSESDIVSIIFSVTGDLTAMNPATALRNSGRGQELALFAVKEAEYPSSLPRTIRALIHCYMEEGSVVKHVYRNNTEGLRKLRLNSAEV